LTGFRQSVLQTFSFSPHFHGISHCYLSFFCLKEVMRNTTENQTNRILSKSQPDPVAHQMINKGDGVLVGVSGGPDSMALLCVLIRLAPDLDIHLGSGSPEPLPEGG
jgi:hypothetical protein